MAVRDALRRLVGQKATDPPGIPEPIFNPVSYTWYYDQIVGMGESQMWRTQPQLRTVVSFLARNIAHLSLQTFARQSDNDRKRLSGARSALLLNRPNPETTGYELVYGLVADLALYDKAYWYITRSGRTNSGWEITRIPPTWVHGMQPAGLFGVSEFIVQPDTGQSSIQSRLPAEKVIYFHGWNPDDPKFGDSPVLALQETLAEQMAAQEFRNQNWRNGGRLNGVIERPESAPDWSDPAKRKFKKGWRDAYSGRYGSDAGGVPILEEGMTYKPIGFSAADNQFVEAAKLSLGTVCGVYHVNPIMVGDNAGSSYCLPADAQVYTTVGPKRIADVTTDDRVWSLEDGQVTDKSVTWSGQTGVMPLLTLRTQNRTLRCTANHPVLVRRKVRIKPDKMRYRWEHAYVPAGELAVGDILVTLNELPDRVDPPAGCGHARVVSIKPDPIPVPVYDLTVDGEHNFVADGVVVHNSNVKEFRKALYGDTLGPTCAQIEARVNEFLLPMIGESPANYVEFNISEKLQGNFEDQAIALQMAVGGPWMTRAEARALNNLPAAPGADQLIVPMNVTSGGQASPRDSAPAPADRTGPGDSQPEQAPLSPGKALDELLRHQSASIVTKIGAGMSVEDAWDDQRWDGKLAAVLGDDLAAKRFNQETKALLVDADLAKAQRVFSERIVAMSDRLMEAQPC